MTATSATTASAVTKFLEGNNAWKPLDAGVMVYRDRAGQGQAPPYVVVSEGIGVVPLARGDNGKGTSAVELVQVDVWQEWRNPATGRTSERYSLSGDIARVLHGIKLITAPQLVFGVKVMNRVRMVEDDANRIHDVITVQVTRKL